MNLSPAQYKLSGGSVFNVKGKEKVSEMAMKFRGGLPTFANPWRSKCSRGGQFSMEESSIPVTFSRANVTSHDINAFNPPNVTLDETAAMDQDKEWEECNK